MLSCSIIVCISLALISGLQKGLCQLTVNAIPAAGSSIVRLPGTQNVNITCQLSNQDGSRRLTNWFIQPDDGVLGSIDPRDTNLVLSGDLINTPLGNISDNSVLIIATLTEDLDKTVVSCGDDLPPLASFTIRLYYPPSLMDRGVVEKRENQEFRVDMADSPLAFPPPSEVSWTKDEAMVDIVSSSSRVFNYSTIFIGSVEPSDSGVYTLTATNYQLNSTVEIGSSSASITLNVLYGSMFDRDGPDTEVVVERENVTLVCGTGLSGNPFPIITWTDNNGSSLTARGGLLLRSDTEEVSLTINSAVRDDDGYWNCSVQVFDSNNLRVGQPVFRSIRLVVVVAPDAPVDIKILDSGPTWIHLEWFQFGNAGNPPVSRHVIRVQETGKEEVIRRDFGVSILANVTGLQPGVKYTFSVIAVSEFGDVSAESPPSSPITGNTTISVPDILCYDPEVKDNELIINWTYIHTGGLEITDTTVFLYNDTTDTYNSLMSEPSASGSGTIEHLPTDTSFSLPLTLTAGISYNFRVTASNMFGPSFTDCPSVFLTTGIPSVPELTKTECIDQGMEMFLSTNYSGVNDPLYDNLTFIIQIYGGEDESILNEIEVPVNCPAGGGHCNKTYYLIHNTTSTSSSNYLTLSARNRYGSSEHSTITIIEECSTSGLDLVIVIGGAVGGGLLLLVAISLLVISACAMRERKTKQKTTKIKPNSLPLVPAVRTREVPSSAVQLTTQNSIYDEWYDGVDPCDRERTSTSTFTHAVSREEEALYEPALNSNMAKREEKEVEKKEEVEGEEVAGTEEPDNDAAMYETMVLETVEDGDYEELNTPAYDVPRRAVPASCEITAYQNTGTGPTYYCTSAGHLV